MLVALVERLVVLGRFVDFAVSIVVALPRAIFRRFGETLSQFERVAWGGLPIAIVAGISVGLVTWLQTRRLLVEYGIEATLPSVLAVAGELDLSSAPSLKWALTDLLGGGCSRLVVDLSRVSFIDSTALGVLVGIQMRLSAGTRLAIVCANANVLEIFELTGLVGTFELFSTLEHALAYARGDAPAAT